MTADKIDLIRDFALWEYREAILANDHHHHPCALELFRIILTAGRVLGTTPTSAILGAF